MTKNFWQRHNNNKLNMFQQLERTQRDRKWPDIKIAFQIGSRKKKQIEPSKQNQANETKFTWQTLNK